MGTFVVSLSAGTGISSVSPTRLIWTTKTSQPRTTTATVKSGYTFSSWAKTSMTGSGGGVTIVSTTATTTSFIIQGVPPGTGSSTWYYTASATANAYTLTTAKGTGVSSVTAGGSKTTDQKVALTASMSTGYSFSSWSSNNGGSFSSTTSASTTFTMPAGNVTVTATGKLNSYTLTVSKGTGIASVSGGGSKGYNTKNAISATLSTGYSFNKWTSSNGGSFSSATSASTSFTMPNNAVTVTASATLKSYTLTLSKGTGIASVSGGGSKGYNTKTQISATASTGYTFKNWTTSSGGTIQSATSATTTYTMPNNAATITANATLNSYTLTLSAGTGIDSVSGGGSKGYNTNNQISATVATGYTFANWTTSSGGTISSATSATTTYTMPNNAATVTANATINTYTLTTAASPIEGGSVTAGDSMEYNSTKELTATPSAGYEFTGWTATSGSLSSDSDNPTTFTIGADDATVTGSFAKVDYSVTIEEDPTGSGTVSVSPSTAQIGDTVMITKTPTTGYEFSGYTTDPEVTIENDQFTMPASNVSITANFSKINYSVTINDNPAGSGTVSVSPSPAQMGDTVTISQTPAAGYEFVSYTADPEVTITNDQFTMPASNVSITANYQLAFLPSTGTLDKASYTGGETAILQISASDSRLSHKYRLRFKDSMDSGLIAVAAGVSSANVYVPIGWEVWVGNETTVSNGVLILETYYNDSLIGRTQINGLSYTAPDNVVPSFKIWRCDANGNPKVNGPYGKYSITVPNTVSSYALSYGQTVVQNPALTGDILPGDKKELVTNMNHMIRLTVAIENETFYFEHDIPEIVPIRKAI